MSNFQLLNLPRNKSTDRISNQILPSSNIRLSSNASNNQTKKMFTQSLAIKPASKTTMNSSTSNINPKLMLNKQSRIQIEGDLNMMSSNNGMYGQNYNKSIKNNNLKSLYEMYLKNNNSSLSNNSNYNLNSKLKEQKKYIKHVPRKSPFPAPRGFNSNNPKYSTVKYYNNINSNLNSNSNSGLYSNIIPSNSTATGLHLSGINGVSHGHTSHGPSHGNGSGTTGLNIGNITNPYGKVNLNHYNNVHSHYPGTSNGSTDLKGFGLERPFHYSKSTNNLQGGASGFSGIGSLHGNTHNINSNNSRSISPFIKDNHKDDHTPKLTPNITKKKYLSKSPLLARSSLLKNFKKYQGSGNNGGALAGFTATGHTQNHTNNNSYHKKQIDSINNISNGQKTYHGHSNSITHTTNIGSININNINMCNGTESDDTGTITGFGKKNVFNTTTSAKLSGGNNLGGGSQIYGKYGNIGGLNNLGSLNNLNNLNSMRDNSSNRVLNSQNVNNDDIHILMKRDFSYPNIRTNISSNSGVSADRERENRENNKNINNIPSNNNVNVNINMNMNINQINPNIPNTMSNMSNIAHKIGTNIGNNISQNIQGIQSIQNIQNMNSNIQPKNAPIQTNIKPTRPTHNPNKVRSHSTSGPTQISELINKGENKDISGNSSVISNNNNNMNIKPIQTNPTNIRIINSNVNNNTNDNITGSNVPSANTTSNMIKGIMNNNKNTSQSLMQGVNISNISNISSTRGERSESQIKKPIKKKIRNIYQFTHVGFDGEQDKPNNQDRAFIQKKFAGNTNYFYFSVCDGHGVEGHGVSEFIKKLLPVEMSSNLKDMNIITENPSEKEILHNKIKETFINANTRLIINNEINSLFSGSTCVSVIYTPTKLICPNIGDSRAVIGGFTIEGNDSSQRQGTDQSKQGKENLKYVTTTKNLTRDHKPTEKDEAKRIYDFGGRIQPFIDDETGDFIGPARVWIKEDDVPGLAMTRSFGDRVAASVGVMSEPEITEYYFCESDKFMLIASDGVWEFISSEECMDIIKGFYLKDDMQGCCNYLYQESRKRWLKEEEVVDDITMILIFFD